MTPPRLDTAVVHRRLQMIEEALDSLRLLGDIDEESLRQDPIRRAAAERLIQLVTDLAFDINGHILVARFGRAPETGRQSFIDLANVGLLDPDLAAALAPSAGLRNILVHHYVDVHLDLVAAAVGEMLNLFPSYVSAIARSILDTD